MDLNPPDIRERFFRSVELAAWALIVCALPLGLILPLSDVQRWSVLLLLGVAGSYVTLVFRLLLPRYGLRRWMHYATLIANIAIVAWAHWLLYPYGVGILFVIVITVTGMTAGWRIALLGAFLAAGANAAVTLLHSGMSLNMLVADGLYFTAFLAAGFLTSSLVGIIRQQREEVERRNQELMLLLDVSHVAAASSDLENLLLSLAEKIAEGLPATYCRICLLSGEGKSLVAHGAYPLHRLKDWNPRLGEVCALKNLPCHREAVQTGNAIIVRRNEPGRVLSEEERQVLFPEGVESVCLIPLTAEGRALGVISLGEERSAQPEPWSPEKLALARTLGTQVTMTVHNIQLYQARQRQARRIAVLNAVARAIGSTIEMESLLELVHQQLALVIPTDTYYVGLYDAADDSMDLRILIDEGERFPPQKIPLGVGLMSLLIRERRPVLIRHMAREIESLPVKPITVGKPKRSESWLGVPMLTGTLLLGVLVVSSYKPYAFDEEDVTLLTNVAEQVALALDNASHHAQVEKQSQRDSLTGVYNHGHFVARLKEEVARARVASEPVSLIMLDIDRFKQYNDTYGHVVGDEVLRVTVQSIQSHVKRTDIVGRWGGEEFGVVLLNATTQQARGVAERIRHTMAALRLTGNRGERIPAPTVSQGIATFPDHVADADALVVMADRMLYRGKSAGRDQVAVAGEQKA